uniref:LysM domain-containing protein n=1 Tax=Quercus lobata TaxID=97700 RepID=A0A7N2KM78_QUELO
MAKRNNTFLNLILVLSLLLIISFTEGRLFDCDWFGECKSTGLECISVYGAQQGDTCSGIVQKFSLNVDFFTAINPNLNCNTIFVGQWLGIDGTMS